MDLGHYLIATAKGAPSTALPLQSDEESQRSRQFPSHGGKIEAQRIEVTEEGRKVWALVETLPDKRFRILGWLE